MFKYTLAATLDEMDREGITVAECPLRSMRCLSLQNGRIVGINTARFDSSADAGVAPGGMQQVAAAYSLAAVVKQHLQQGKLLRGQENILPVARNGACLPVNIQILVMRCGISAVHSHTITSFGGKFQPSIIYKRGM